MKKITKVSGSVGVFLSAKSRNEPETEEAMGEVSELKKFFEVEDLDTVVTLQLKLENMLWVLFEAIQPPESPLRAKAHQRFKDKAAEALNASLESDDKLPVLTEEEVNAVKHFVEDPEEFSKLQFRFEFLRSDGKVSLVPLPSSNILKDQEFLETLEEIFGTV